MRIVLMVLLSIILFGCGSNSEKTASPTKDSSASVPDTSTLPSFSKEAISKGSQPIEGIWFQEGNEVSGIVIRKDSIFYPETFETFYYKIMGDSILIHYADYVYRGRVSRLADTLIMEDENGKVKFIKERK